MTRPLRTLFIIADGSRARWVVRSHKADDFSTVQTLRAGDPGWARVSRVEFASASDRPLDVEGGGDLITNHRDRFACQVAKALNDAGPYGGLERLVIVAPPRMLAALRAKLTQATGERVVATLAKDLSRIPDHELAAWLRPLELT